MATAPPDAVIQDLDRISDALDTTIPARTDTNLLVATWNVRAFGDLTSKWVAGQRDSPKRDWHAVSLHRRSHLPLRRHRPAGGQAQHKALRFLLERLGPNWRVIASDVAEGSAGNGERLAFLYDSDRVQPSGLVGEIVLPPIGDDPARQFACTPYFAGFSRNGTEFTLASVHVLWGKNAAEPLPEVIAFAQWMRNWADLAQRLEPQPDGTGRLQPGPHWRPSLRSIYRHRPMAANRAKSGAPSAALASVDNAVLNLAHRHAVGGLAAGILQRSG